MKQGIKICKSIHRSIVKFVCIVKNNLEPIGLLLLLFSFGWQCFEEHSNNTVYEAHILNLNEKLNAIWDATYDEVVHTERFQNECTRQGKTVSYWLNYEDTNRRTFKDWRDTKEEISVVESQRDFGWSCRLVLYILGSVLIIIPKIQKTQYH